MGERIKDEPAKKKFGDRFIYVRRLYHQFTNGALHPIRTIIRMAQKEIGIFRAFCEKNKERRWFR